MLFALALSNSENMCVYLATSIRLNFYKGNYVFEKAVERPKAANAVVLVKLPFIYVLPVSDESL